LKQTSLNWVAVYVLYFPPHKTPSPEKFLKNHPASKHQNVLGH